MLKRICLVTAIGLIASLSIWSCSRLNDGGDSDLYRSTHLQLVDWHIAGLMIINSPVAWVKVNNYNNVPIEEVTFQYDTFDTDGHRLDQGTFTLDGSIPSKTQKNFIEQYLGIVSVDTERLSIKLLSVKRAHDDH